ncbi:hypothetical protein [Chryseolinea lacunae]|uniref:PorV/PorQ family protein n=1 Tax=Chryseolinea lacunae TaxID=2801331 RepID=A0ABS1KPH2_9BACT|nr:hypothetical protein [Chryseolinea lacunae]MBL0741330.1 hypothetical protein [Chryseolinea lacunae]
MKATPIAFAMLIVSPLCIAQSSSTQMSARALGMGYASGCSADEWSLFNNIGGLSGVTQTTAAFTYNAVPSFKPFNRTAALVATPLSFGVVGAGVYRFGDDVYNEHMLSVGFSNAFGLASLGAKATYVQYNITGFGTKGVVSVSFGGIATLTSRLSVGAYITNLTQPLLSTTDNERLPTVITAGVAFKASDNTSVTTELQKDLDYALLWKTGLECRVHKKVFARTGFNLHPNAAFAGLGFRPKRFALDYAFQYTGTFGAHHEATVAYRVNSKQP